MKANKKRKFKKKKKEYKIKPLKPLERVALDVLKNAKRGLSTNEVSNFSGMSWATSKKHLKGLEKKRKTVHSKKKGKLTRWSIK